MTNIIKLTPNDLDDLEDLLSAYKAVANDACKTGEINLTPGSVEWDWDKNVVTFEIKGGEDRD